MWKERPGPNLWPNRAQSSPLPLDLWSTEHTSNSTVNPTGNDFGGILLRTLWKLEQQLWSPGLERVMPSSLEWAPQVADSIPHLYSEPRV
jgi:hypothetical protein